MSSLGLPPTTKASEQNLSTDILAISDGICKEIADPRSTLTLLPKAFQNFPEKEEMDLILSQAQNRRWT